LGIKINLRGEILKLNYTKAKIASNLTSIELVSDSMSDSFFFRKLEEKGVKLNEDQIILVRHKEGATQVNSGAGAGKSSSVVARLSYLDQVHKIDLEKVLLITFTSKAAEEMLAKASKLGMTSKDKLKKVTAGTFHKVFLDILRENGEDREVFSSDKGRQITIKTILRAMKIDKKHRPEDILALISHYKQNAIDVFDYRYSDKYDKEFHEIWQQYEAHKNDKSLIDFDDMLLLAYQKLSDDEDLLESVRDRWHYIMVDEAQDTSDLQFKLIEMIAHPRNNICIIGDADQCVYSFSGAKLNNILEFPKKYENVKTIELKVNYRCTSPILGMANDAIKKNILRIPKESFAIKESDLYPVINKYETTEDEAEAIVEYIKSQVKQEKRKYSDFAVLYRTNSISRSIFESLLLNEVPFTSFSGGEVFYDNGTVKPILSYLRIIVDPYDFSSMGDVLPTLYIAKDKLKELGKLQQANPIANPIEYASDIVSSAYQKRKIAEKINHMKRIAGLRPMLAIRALREDYESYLIGDAAESESTSLHREIIRETLNELENSSKKFNEIGEYVRHIERIIKQAKIQKENKSKNNSNGVKLMTIHKSKGLEFPVVFALTVNDGLLPHKSSLEPCSDNIGNGVNEALEEERRLAYVLMTRAEEQLNLSYVNTYRGKVAIPSRFIQDYI
jgi:DNA helicase-2/ATP-dependent DNA helicase PcrA